MSKIILEFDGVEEGQDARTAMDGYKWKMSMQDLDQELRSTAKHGISLLNDGNDATDAEYEIAEKIREKIRDILNGYGLTLID